MHAEIKKKFRDCIKSFKKKLSAEQIRFLLGHERLPVAIDNTCDQIVRAEKGNIVFNTRKHNLFIATSAGMFANVAIAHRDQQNLSDAEKTRLTRKGDALKEAEGEISELRKDAEGKFVSYPVNGG